MSTQKGYKLKISQLGTQKGYENVREIELSFVTLCSELHQIIQVLYGLENRHLWFISNKEKNADREVYPNFMFEEEIYTNANEIVKANDVLIAQFISKRFKTVYYTYDYGVSSQWKIEYKGLTKVTSRSFGICTGYKGFQLLEDMPIWEQIELMEIFKQKDNVSLQKKYDWFSSWKDFEEFMEPVFENPKLQSLTEEINNIETISTFK